MIDNILTLFAKAFAQPYLMIVGILIGFLAIIVTLEIYRKKASHKIEVKRTELLKILHDSRDKQVKFYSEFKFKTFNYQKEHPKTIYLNMTKELKANSHKTWSFYKEIHKKKYHNYSSIEDDARAVNQHIRIAEDLISKYDRFISGVKKT